MRPIGLFLLFYLPICISRNVNNNLTTIHLYIIVQIQNPRLILGAPKFYVEVNRKDVLKSYFKNYNATVIMQTFLERQILNCLNGDPRLILGAQKGLNI